MDLELSEVCEGSLSRTMELIFPLFIIELSGMSISILPYYQTEKKFEDKYKFVKLFDKNSSNWAELWEPITKKFPDVVLERIIELLKPSEKTNFEQLKEKLNAI